MKANDQATLTRFMSYFHERQKRYPLDHEFSKDELVAVTPNAIRGWLCQNAFGKPNPGPNELPSRCTFSAVRSYKDTLKRCMPSSDPWDPVKKTGNPADSEEVKDFMSKLKKLEVKRRLEHRRKQKEKERRRQVFEKEKEEQKQRCLMHEEAVKSLEEEVVSETRDVLLAMYNQNLAFQQMHAHWVQITAETTAALNEMKATLEMNNEAIRQAFGFNEDSPDEKGKMSIDEAASDSQTLDELGEFDTAVLSDNPKTLKALWQEYDLGLGGNKPAKCFSSSERAKKRNRDKFSERKPFWDVVEKMIGSGYSSSEAVQMIREVYGKKTPLPSILKELENDREKYYPDGVHPDLKVDSELRKEKIPNLMSQRPAKLSKCHSMELLWKEYVEGIHGRKPAKFFTAEERGKVKTTYCWRRNFWALVEKIISSDGCTPEESFSKIRSVYGNKTMSNLLDDIRQEKKKYTKGVIHPQFGVDFHFETAIEVETKESSNNGYALPAVLSRVPRTLRELWLEYTVGLDGNKPAKEFTKEERGRDKTAYCLRKIFWDLMQKMVESGYTSDEAIAMIHHVYGSHKGTYSICLSLRSEKKKHPNGFHPDLSVDSALRKEKIPLLAKHDLPSCLPPNLTVLWEEYDVGVNGKKPAKQFTVLERRASGERFETRMPFWALILALMRKGCSANTAIQKIHEVYGVSKSVSDILDCLKDDQARYPEGINPSLLENN